MENAGPDDMVYTFDPVTGGITFGDGESGMIPEKGAKILVDYHHKNAGFTEYYDAMKAVDPDIKIFANLPWAFNFVEGTKCDGIVYHNYYTYSANLKNAEELHDAYMKMADDLVLSIDNNVSQLRERTKRQDTIAAVTEFGSINNAVIYSKDTSEYGRDEARSLSRALSFAVTFMGSSKAESLIHIHQAFTAYSFGGGEKLPNADFVYNSMYAPDSNEMVSFIEGGTALAYKVIGNNIGDTYRNSYVLNNPKAGGRTKYDALTTSVTVDEETGDLYLMVVNRDSEEDITAIINLGGYTITGSARIQTLNGEDITSCNTPDNPNALSISETIATFGVGESSFSYTFPAHSLVAIKLSGTSQSVYGNSITEDFDTADQGSVPQLLTATGNAGVQTVDGNQVLTLSHSGSNTTVKLPLSATEQSVDGISRIKFKISAQQATNARLQVTLKSGRTETMIFAMESGFVKNDAKIRAVYTTGQFHEFEIAIDHKSGQYVLYFDGSYIGSPGEFVPGESGSQEIVITAMTANGTFHLDDYSVQTVDTDAIRAIVSIDGVTASTAVGKAPSLPDTVTVHYNTGESETRTVVWETVSADDLTAKGQITVLGKVDNLALCANALITVTGEDGTAPGEPGQEGGSSTDAPETDVGTKEEPEDTTSLGIWIGIGSAGAVIVIVAVIFAVVSKNKKKAKSGK